MRPSALMKRESERSSGRVVAAGCERCRGSGSAGSPPAAWTTSTGPVTVAELAGGAQARLEGDEVVGWLQMGWPKVNSTSLAWCHRRRSARSAPPCLRRNPCRTGSTGPRSRRRARPPGPARGRRKRAVRLPRRCAGDGRQGPRCARTASRGEASGRVREGQKTARPKMASNAGSSVSPRAASARCRWRVPGRGSGTARTGPRSGSSAPP